VDAASDVVDALNCDPEGDLDLARELDYESPELSCDWSLNLIVN
jgi:hypothetical protein